MLTAEIDEGWVYGNSLDYCNFSIDLKRFQNKTFIFKNDEILFSTHQINKELKV